MKNLVIRKGDTVRIRRGSFRGIEGEVSNIDLKNMRLTIEGVTFEKADGSSQHFPVRACNCEIINLKNMKDKRRKAIVDRRLTTLDEDVAENEEEKTN